ncbi:MAG: SDR family NAD(P)-dependent oxidoreductase [Isosphaeraceae bacterium]
MADASKTALITGAGSGIGRGIAEALDALGYRPRCSPRRQEAGGNPRASSNRPAPPTVSCDVADRDQVKTSVDRTLKELGAIDVLVCNAGINVRNRGLEVLDPADFDKMVATILTGSFNLVHFVLPSMRARGSGLVIQIDSVSGKRASVLGGAGYSAAKFGQAGLGLTLGREEGPRGIRSTVIYPGEVETPILDARPVPVGADRRSVILQPADVAAAVKFLVELHPRASVPELIIKPTCDDYA